MIAQAGALAYENGEITPWEKTTITQRYGDIPNNVIGPKVSLPLNMWDSGIAQWLEHLGRYQRSLGSSPHHAELIIPSSHCSITNLGFRIRMSVK